MVTNTTIGPLHMHETWAMETDVIRTQLADSIDRRYEEMLQLWTGS